MESVVRSPDDTAITARVKHPGSPEAFEPATVSVSVLRSGAVVLRVETIGPAGPAPLVVALLDERSAMRLWARVGGLV